MIYAVRVCVLDEENFQPFGVPLVITDPDELIGSTEYVALLANWNPVTPQPRDLSVVRLQRRFAPVEFMTRLALLT